MAGWARIRTLCSDRLPAGGREADGEEDAWRWPAADFMAAMDLGVFCSAPVFAFGVCFGVLAAFFCFAGGVLLLLLAFNCFAGVLAAFAFFVDALLLVLFSRGVLVLLPPAFAALPGGVLASEEPKILV